MPGGPRLQPLQAASAYGHTSHASRPQKRCEMTLERDCALSRVLDLSQANEPYFDNAMGTRYRQANLPCADVQANDRVAPCDKAPNDCPEHIACH
jgi:hypothetical protein